MAPLGRSGWIHPFLVLSDSVSLKITYFPQIATSGPYNLLRLWQHSRGLYAARDELQEMTNVNRRTRFKMMRNFKTNAHSRQRGSCWDWLVVTVFPRLSPRGSETNRKLIEAVHSGRMTQITAYVSSSSLQTCNPERRPTPTPSLRAQITNMSVERAQTA